MKASHIKEAFLDRPSKVQIVLSKFVFDEDTDFHGWECDVFYEDEFIGGGTAPTQEGIYDLANEIIWDYENPSEW